jgi:3-hydroxyacyl-[acyl-carrier-protein] dehydratase
VDIQIKEQTMSEHMQPVMDLITQRPPYLFLEELISADEHTTVGRKYFDPELEFFKGHFPKYPVVPGVLLIETMAQCGGAGLRQIGFLAPEVFFVLGTVEKAKFRNQVRPGDTALIEVKNLRVSQIMVRQSGTITVNGKLAAEATWMCMLGAQPKPAV